MMVVYKVVWSWWGYGDVECCGGLGYVVFFMG